MGQTSKGRPAFLNITGLLTLAADLSAAEFGLFSRLLLLHKLNGSLPADVEDLRRIAGTTPGEFAESWPAVSSHFISGEDGLLRPVDPDLIVSKPNFR